MWTTIEECVELYVRSSISFHDVGVMMIRENFTLALRYIYWMYVNWNVGIVNKTLKCYLSRIDHNRKIRTRKRRTDVGKSWVVNRTIQRRYQLPAGLLASLPCSLNTFRKRVKKTVTSKVNFSGDWGCISEVTWSEVMCVNKGSEVSWSEADYFIKCVCDYFNRCVLTFITLSCIMVVWTLSVL
jgi:hypothetical protein